MRKYQILSFVPAFSFFLFFAFMFLNPSFASRQDYGFNDNDIIIIETIDDSDASSAAETERIYLTRSEIFPLYSILKHYNYYINKSMIVSGIRIEARLSADADYDVKGGPMTPNDWLFADSGCAVWVTGASAPEINESVILIVDINNLDETTALKAPVALKLFSIDSGVCELALGEYAYFSLPTTRSTVFIPEIEGGSVMTVYGDGLKAHIIKAVHPGESRVTIYEKTRWYPDPDKIAEVKVTVKAPKEYNDSATLDLALYLNHGGSNADTVNAFIHDGADVNHSDADFKLTPLHGAAHYGRTDIAEILIKNGADLNAQNIEGNTPLYAAAFMRHKETVSLLAESGADVNIANKYGYTPLRAAAFKGDADILRVLLKAGADPSIKDNKGLTPLKAAEKNGHWHIVKILSELKSL